MARAVALLSGGLDSGTSLALWLARGHAVDVCLFFDYGQRSTRSEQRAATALAGRFGLPVQIVHADCLADAAERAGSALLGGVLPQGTTEQPGDAASAAAVWVPARNVFLLAAAASQAESYGAEHVLAGFNREEAATFPDNSAAFVAAMDAVLALGTRSRVRVACPTIGMDKVAIVAAAREQGLTQADFYSCYAAGPQPCGGCESCLRSARAWAANH